MIEPAQICVSELVANVIRHVGAETPTTLAVSMSGMHVRIEIRDPDPRALPTLLASELDAESGRGLALVDAVAERWGVVLREDHKIVWCELATGLTSPDGHTGGLVTEADGYLSRYNDGRQPGRSRTSRLRAAQAEEAAIDLIADVLHWLRAHGCDPDEALDRAQTHFEAEVESTRCRGQAAEAPA